MDWLPAALGFGGTVCAILFGYVAFLRNRSKDATDTGQESGIMHAELGYVKSGIDDVKRKQEKQDSQHIEIISRLVKVEASATQAHARLDSVMGNRNQLNKDSLE